MIQSLRMALRWPPWARARPPWWRALTRPGPPRAVCALALGDERAAMVRVAPGGDGRLRLQAADVATPDALRGWARQRRFAGARTVLVLPAAERHLLMMDDPAVPAEERALAVRFPLAEALDAEPAELLTTAVAMPRISDAPRPQLLAVAARLGVVRERLGVLARAGIPTLSVDVADSALRGMALLTAPAQPDRGGTIALATMAQDLSIGLLWRGRFCALRSLALPERRPGDEADFVEQVAVQIQRTVDHAERQATRLAVRDVLASLPTLTAPEQRALLQALPLAPRAFDLAAAMAVEPQAADMLAAHPELVTLACVAALRLLDTPADGDDLDVDGAPDAAGAPSPAQAAQAVLAGLAAPPGWTATAAAARERAPSPAPMPPGTMAWARTLAWGEEEDGVAVGADGDDDDADGRGSGSGGGRP